MKDGRGSPALITLTTLSSITAMAGRDSRCIDDRNRASYEMCQMLASMLEDTRLPFI